MAGEAARDEDRGVEDRGDEDRGAEDRGDEDRGAGEGTEPTLPSPPWWRSER
ncbi:MAG: hypothetical protein AMXMBFR46_25890 [Acidimicrobiia bacterium]